MKNIDSKDYIVLDQNIEKKFYEINFKNSHYNIVLKNFIL